MTVRRILEKQGITIPRFKDNVTGEEWSYSFLKRHESDLKNCVCQNILKKRAQLSHDTIEAYFDEGVPLSEHY